MYTKANRKNSTYDRRVMFNRDVLARLDAVSPDHAATLRRCGENLHWWAACDYARTAGHGVQSAVDYILSKEATVHV
jgi:hypothetical protein